ncbi:MAG: D-alanyl-D-alanine carboxypeptidase [Lachnospiraceae bacterium]|nr:D-alanyl-D-alanine carboxypeptidase [Lachnospiraceae bacterium]
MRIKLVDKIMLSLLLLLSFLIISPDQVFAKEKETVSETSTEEASTEETSSEETEEKATVEVEGLKLSLNVRKNKACGNAITFTPSEYERTAKLKLYDSAKKTYTTVATYDIPAGDEGLWIEYPKKYRKKTTGIWQLTISGTEDTKAYKSEDITVTTINVGKLTLNSKEACIYCVEDDAVIFGKKENTAMKMASTTKVMTAVVAIESGKLGNKVKISEYAAKTAYGNLYMKVGDQYKIKDMMNALMICSANDGAVAIAEGVSGTEKKFVDEMNEKASKLGLRNTHYVTPHGLDKDGHQTTPRELAKLTGYAYTKHAFFRGLIKKKKYSFKSTGGRWHTVHSKDILLGYDKGFKGGKTGYTKGAGTCFTGVYVYKGKTYICTSLGAKTSDLRWVDQKTLHGYVRKYAVSY